MVISTRVIEWKCNEIAVDGVGICFEDLVKRLAEDYIYGLREGEEWKVVPCLGFGLNNLLHGRNVH